MLTKMGAVLLDFGLAKLSDVPDPTNPSTTIDLTREGTIVGTVRYMAPEVSNGAARMRDRICFPSAQSSTK